MRSKIVTIVFGIIFIIGMVFSIVNASMLIGEGIKEVINYDECDGYKPVMLERSNETVEPYQDNYCINNQKRRISESLAYLIVSVPLTIFFYRKFREE